MTGAQVPMWVRAANWYDGRDAAGGEPPASLARFLTACNEEH